MNDINRKFNNELAAYKKGENIDHSEPEMIVTVSNKSFSSFFKLGFILIILSASGYYLIKVPFAKHQIENNFRNATANSMSLKSYKKVVQTINPDLLKTDSLVNKLYESNISPNTLQKMASVGLLTSTSMEFYTAMNDIIGKDSINDLSSVSLFLERNSEQEFLKAVEVNADVLYIVELQNSPFFSSFSYNDVLNISLADTDRSALLYSHPKLHANTYTEWIDLIDQCKEPDYINDIMNADYNNELDLDKVLTLYSAKVSKDDVLKMLKSGTVSTWFKALEKKDN